MLTVQKSARRITADAAAALVREPLSGSPHAERMWSRACALVGAGGYSRSDPVNGLSTQP